MIIVNTTNANTTNACQCRSCIDERIDLSRQARLLDPGQFDDLQGAIEDLSSIRLVECQICHRRSCPHAEHHDNICEWPDEEGVP